MNFGETKNLEAESLNLFFFYLLSSYLNSRRCKLIKKKTLLAITLFSWGYLNCVTRNPFPMQHFHAPPLWSFGILGKTFPGQMMCLIPLVSSGSTPGSPHSWKYPGKPPQSTSWSPQAAPLAEQQQQLCSFISKGPTFLKTFKKIATN